MVITKYKEKMLISPKSKKLGMSVCPILFDDKKKYYKANNDKTDKIFTGFKVFECVNDNDALKHNKKRTKSHKFIS